MSNLEANESPYCSSALAIACLVTENSFPTFGRLAQCFRGRGFPWPHSLPVQWGTRSHYEGLVEFKAARLSQQSLCAGNKASPSQQHGGQTKMVHAPAPTPLEDQSGVWSNRRARTCSLYTAQTNEILVHRLLPRGAFKLLGPHTRTTTASPR